MLNNYYIVKVYYNRAFEIIFYLLLLVSLPHMKYLLLGITTLMTLASASFYIDDYGAVPHSDTIEAQHANCLALAKAIAAANASSSQSERRVIIGKRTYFFLGMHIEYVHNLHVMVLGRVVASKSVKEWPHEANQRSFLPLLQFYYCDNLTISGGGKIDGRGYHWWMLLLLNDKKLLDGERPNLIHLWRCRNSSIHDLVLKNSPQYHIKMDDCPKAVIHSLNIKVNTTAQVNLLRRFSLEGVIPMFPFNTDGVDPHGTDMHIYNLTVQNWDDVVVPKPGSSSDLYGNCTENFLVENITVRLGVGMSIGSVPPATSFRCIRNVTFRNVQMQNPFKGIYVKTNPGNNGGGLISGIHYQNITMASPIWWAIYIGPQQMLEPDGTGPGCMLYPFDPKGRCGTQPLITINNITLQNVSITDSLLYPVTIRCNVSNPCRYFDFQNVTVNRWRIGGGDTGVVCEYVTGSQRACRPAIPCFYDGWDLDHLQQIHPILPQPKLTAELFWREVERAVSENPYQDDDPDDFGDLSTLELEYQ